MCAQHVGSSSESSLAIPRDVTELTAEVADSISGWAPKVCETGDTHAHQISAEKRIRSASSRDFARDLDIGSGGRVDLSGGD